MSEFIRIDGAGAITAEDATSRARLGERAGRYYLAPTCADLILAVRAPSTGGVSPQPRVALCGDLSCIALADTIAFLNQSRLSGVLQVITPAGERAIVLKGGEVRGAASDAPTDKLGEIAVRLGLITRAQLEEIIASRASSPGRLGRALVDAGYLQPHQLWKCMQHQVSDIFYAILVSREGLFLFVDQPIEDRGSVSISTQALLMDAVRRIDEMKEFRKRLPSSQAYVAQKGEPPALEPLERGVWELCTGERTVAEIAQSARLSEFETTKVLHHLLQAGCVQVMAAARPQPAHASVPVDVGRVVRTFNSSFRLIFAELREQPSGADFADVARQALQSQAARAPFLEGLRFGPAGELAEARLLEQVQSSGGPEAEQLRLLRGALSELLSFLLFESGERLGVPAHEALTAQVRQLLAPLEGELPPP